MMVHRTGQAKRKPLLRCPACGERIDPSSPTKCPLCEFEFGDDRVTNADVTPYAAAAFSDARTALRPQPVASTPTRRQALEKDRQSTGVLLVIG